MSPLIARGNVDIDHEEDMLPRPPPAILGIILVVLRPHNEALTMDVNYVL